MAGYWYADIVGPNPFLCELCLATGFAFSLCPYHDEFTWDEWMTQEFKQWAWSTMWRLRVGTSVVEQRPGAAQQPLPAS